MVCTNKANIKIIEVHFDVISDEDKDYIKKNLVEIAKGVNSKFEPKTIAKKLLNMFESQSVKSNNNKNGLTAEFFQAVIIRNQGFEQKYVYKNLEENSAKKGFDGIYQKNGDIWILESKASADRQEHKTTIDRAYKDVVEKLSGTGKSKNDPWENAASHSRVYDPSNSSLIDSLEKLSKDYTEGNFQDVKDYRIILGSSVIANDINNVETDVPSVQNYLQNHKSKKEIVNLITYSSPELFIDLLKEITNG